MTYVNRILATLILVSPLVSFLGVTVGTTSTAYAQPKKKSGKTATTLPARKGGTKASAPGEATPVANEGESAPDEIETLPRKNVINVDSKNAIRLNYGRSEWNRDATKIDEAIIFMREGASGRVVQIQAEETAPDSAVFSGTYSINWQSIEAMRPEFYAPPQKLLADMNGRMKITQMIDSKELRRLPFVMRRDPITGIQNIELFDTVDQARAAYRAYQSEQQLLEAMKNKTLQSTKNKNAGTYAERDQTVDTALLAERAALEKIAKDLNERVRLSQIEMQRLSELIKKFSALTPAERAKQKREAQALADQAMIDYRADRFAQARDSFDKAVELDPTNRSYYFQYGVTLYKLTDYNRSLVYLDLAEGKDVPIIERDFYRGLNYYQLKDSKNALEAFTKVVDAKDSEISPSANFYRGLLYFDKKNWDEARKEFQTVLDTSNDPALDERAEAYLENIIRQQQIEAERAHRWTLNGTFGLIYDDNVLTSSDSDRDRGTATDLEAYRTLLSGSARYRAIYEKEYELAVQLDAMTMFSVDKTFQRKQTLTNADPTVLGLSVPWTYKSVFLGKGYKFDFIPGYESTIMSSDNNETKPIYNSYIGGFQNLVVMNERWYTNVNLEIRKDMYNMSTSTGDDDSTALKTKITWSNINFLEDKKQIVLSEVAYTSNDALGKNVIFNRFDLGVGYVAPWRWNTTFITKLNYFLLTYPQNSTGRIDNDYTLLLGASRPWTEKLLLGLNGTYAINNSNVSAYQYKKFNLMLTLTANEAF